MTVLPFLYENFQHSQSECVAWALACFAQLMRLQPDRMRQYPELTLVNILEVQKNASKAVSFSVFWSFGGGEGEFFVGIIEALGFWSSGG
jgi:hypothetical protein